VDGVEKKNTEGLRESSELMDWITARLVFAHNSRTLFGFRALAYPEGAKTIAISGYRQVMAWVLLAAEMTCRNTAAVSPLHPRSISTFFPFNVEVNPTDLDEVNATYCTSLSPRHNLVHHSNECRCLSRAPRARQVVMY